MEVPRGFTRCDECEGKGRFERSNGSSLVRSTWPVPARCRSCSGSGLVPTEKLREEAIAVARSKWGHSFPDLTDAVLRKVAEHIREGR